MAAQQFDAFLPSAATGEAPRFLFPGISSLPRSNLASPNRPPRSVPDYIPQRSPFLPPQHPMSPPSSRSTSTDNNSAALIEDWRRYTHNLREQFQGERAHLVADRIRADEVMAEGQELWERERALLKAQIAELEARLAICTCYQTSHQGSIDGALASPCSDLVFQTASQLVSPTQSITTSTTISASVERPQARIPPQESGRNPDGSPFYAPAAQNPSRSFGPNHAVEMRIENMPAPIETPLKETPLRVPAKELTEADFGPQSPAAQIASGDGSIVGESIDISQLQPELEGVPIKFSAVVQTHGGTFGAKVLSPGQSLSPPSVHSPPLHDGMDDHPKAPVQEKKTTLQVISAPANRRLTMNAGHTPNHSVHKFELGDSGNSTPTQNRQLLGAPSIEVDVDLQPDGQEDEDPKLSGPLGLVNVNSEDDVFLATLTEKLKEVEESKQESSSPPGEVLLNDTRGSGQAGSSHQPNAILTIIGENDDVAPSVVDDVPEVPRLRVKASTNFGKPFGCI
ncbi:MAG: hypothetical protein M1818_007345 [Claussenomyces sp. TS43310]|nr:MAG: hypothetical protein M1818_007345 [Claussenomyces sp. TS43310]